MIEELKTIESHLDIYPTDDADWVMFKSICPSCGKNYVRKNHVDWIFVFSSHAMCHECVDKPVYITMQFNTPKGINKNE